MSIKVIEFAPEKSHWTKRIKPGEQGRVTRGKYNVERPFVRNPKKDSDEVYYLDKAGWDSTFDIEDAEPLNARTEIPNLVSGQMMQVSQFGIIHRAAEAAHLGKLVYKAKENQIQNLSGIDYWNIGSNIWVEILEKGTKLEIG